MDRLGIARALGETADLLALTGEEPFRARAYQRGARVLEALSDADFGRLLAEGRLTTLAGIGRGLAVVIGDLARSGRSSALEQVRGALPGGARELSRIPNLGLKKIRALHQALGVETIAELRAACEAGLAEDKVAALCRIAGAVDKGLFEGAGFAFENRTWTPGAVGCCLLRVEPKPA